LPEFQGFGIIKLPQLKAKLRLFDGTILWVREIWNVDSMEAYSYYWLRSDETIIIGWDNAPHHQNVTTYPHHKHLGDKVEPSTQNDLRNILFFIEDFFE
jgi:hypothetical protein